MKGVIFYSGKYGSTAQYAKWISEATGLPFFDVNTANEDLSKYDFLILGSSVIINRLTIRKWIRRNLAGIKNKRVILFTVSGEPSGQELDVGIAASVPDSLSSHMEHVALRGRLDLKKVSWWTRLLLKIGAWHSDDPETKEHLLKGFDLMDKSGIDPIKELVQKYKSA